MSQVWHLVRQDLRAHRTILIAWLAVFIGHPLFALVPWSRQADAGLALGAAVLLVGARIVLGALAIAAIVQADSPIDDRAFWRTRPIRSATVATAHFALVVAVFVVAPTIAVFLIALALRVPLPQLPWALGGVAVTELAFASLALVVASRTHGTAVFLIGVVLALGVTFALPLTADAIISSLQWPPEPTRFRPDPLKGMMATVAVGAVVLPPLFLVAMGGPRRQQVFIGTSLAGLALSTSLWFHPWLNRVPRRDAGVRLSSQPDAVRVLDVPGTPGVVALVLDVVPEAGRVGDAWRVTVMRGQLTTPEGTRNLGGGRGVSDLPPVTAPAVRTVLTVLSADEHRRLTGARVRLEAVVEAHAERRPTEGTAPLLEGATIATDHSRLRITEIRGGGTLPDGTPDLRLRGVALTMQPASIYRHGHQYVLRDKTTGCEAPFFYSPTEGGRGVMEAALLPTLMRPFVTVRVALVARGAKNCDLEAARAEVDMRTFDYEYVPDTSFSLDFTMPAVGEAFRPAPPSEQVLGPRPVADRNAVRQLTRLDAGAGREATP